MNDPLTPLTPSQTAKQEQQTLKNSYIHNVGVAEDQAFNVITGGLPDETISAREARADKNGSKFGRFFSWLLTKTLGKNHGAKAVAGDAARAAQVEQVEQNSGLINGK